MAYDSPPLATSGSVMTRPSVWNVVYSIAMGIACAIAYVITSSMLFLAASRDDDLLGGMWAAVSAAFVFRDTQAHSLSAAADRLIATCVSFALCFLYVAILPPSAVAIPILVAAGALVITVLNRREDIITTAITTIVVMVVAIITPAHAWIQPILRFFDTLVGVGVGIGCRWAASTVFRRRD